MVDEGEVWYLSPSGGAYFHSAHSINTKPSACVIQYVLPHSAYVTSTGTAANIPAAFATNLRSRVEVLEASVERDRTVPWRSQTAISLPQHLTPNSLLATPLCALNTMTEVNAPLRRSSRAAARRAACKTELHDVGQEEQTEDFVPPQKKRRLSGKGKAGSSSNGVLNTRRLKGKLALLPSTPLDVLLQVRVTLSLHRGWRDISTRQVFSHLDVTDLLSLCRTSWSFRRLLLNRSTRSIWIGALSEVPDLPRCPSDMAEPAFAHLAFEPFCHVRRDYIKFHANADVDVYL